jgi:hypothetical protein
MIDAGDIMSAVGSMRRNMPLILFGVASELIYLFSFVRRFPLLRYYHTDTDMGAILNHSELGFLSFYVAFSSLFILLLMAWWYTPVGDDRDVLKLILGAGGVFGLTMTFMYPITAIDVMTYVTESRILLHYHENPIIITASQYSKDPILALADGWSSSGAPYGPIGIVIDAIPSMISNGDLLLTLIGLKVLFSCMILGTAFCTYRILCQISKRHALTGALLIAWNPLIIFEVSGNGHNDIAMMFFAMLGLLFIVENDFMMGTLLIVTSALVKYGTVFLLPLCLIYCLEHLPTKVRRMRYLATVVAGAITLAALAFFPFWEGMRTFSESLAQNQRLTDSLASVLTYYMPSTQASFIGRVLFVPAYLYTAWLSAGKFQDFLTASLLATLFLMALAVNNIEPWYFVWTAILAAAIPSFSLRLAACTAAIGAEVYTGLFAFVWVWIGLDTADSFPTVNVASYIATYLPTFVIIGTLGYASLHPSFNTERDASWVA